jgi:DNA repair protein RadA/Sms
VSAPARPIAEVDVNAARARGTGVGELDRVLGGGIVPGSVVLLAGEPGVGKSTLLLDVAQHYAQLYADQGGRALVVTGEESAAQVRLRAERIGALHPELFLAAETSLSALVSHVDEVRPSLLIVDSVQTIAAADVDGAPGGVTQVRSVAAALIALAKERGIATVLVGHVTKDGSIAGPRVLEHLVDVVLQFEGDRNSTLRLVRAVKNRYGAADEVGCFELHDSGISGLADPSGLFLGDRRVPVSGACVTVTVEGRRPLLTEVQALTDESQAVPRRAFAGLDSARMAMVLAVLDRRAGVRLGKLDVYTATVGGIRIVEPAADLAVALAIASSVSDIPLGDRTIALGEIGLVGELRPVGAIRQRLAEAARLGFGTALIPSAQTAAGPLGGARIRTVAVPDLGAAVRYLSERPAHRQAATQARRLRPTGSGPVPVD